MALARVGLQQRGGGGSEEEEGNTTVEGVWTLNRNQGPW